MPFLGHRTPVVAARCCCFLFRLDKGEKETTMIRKNEAKSNRKGKSPQLQEEDRQEAAGAADPYTVRGQCLLLCFFFWLRSSSPTHTHSSLLWTVSIGAAPPRGKSRNRSLRDARALTDARQTARTLSSHHQSHLRVEHGKDVNFERTSSHPVDEPRSTGVDRPGDTSQALALRWSLRYLRNEMQCNARMHFFAIVRYSFDVPGTPKPPQKEADPSA
jgi:hypothetical protein